jgi:antitoxin (DNA-binding transcriptional repressor) of toxin-antitoxin stability system
MGIAWRNGLAKVASRSYLEPMRAVGLKVLKNKLSQYVRLAASGETVLVTDRERVVAELTPPRKDRPAVVLDALLADLVEKGWLTPPQTPADGPIPRRPVMSHAQLMAELDLDRADR